MTAIEFNTAIINLHSNLKPIAFKLTRNNDDAADLIQDTLVKALANRNKFKDGTNLKAWLYTIMKNTFITQYHRMTRQKTYLAAHNQLQYVNTAKHSTQNRASGNLVMDEIHAAIETLSDAYKKPFMMHHTGFKYHEIAEELAIPIGTVKNRIHIARKALKQELKVYQA